MINEYVAYTKLDPEALKQVEEIYERIKNSPELESVLEQFRNKETDYVELQGQIIEYAGKLGVEGYTLCLVMVCAGLPVMKENYDKLSVSQKIFEDSVADVSCKADECKKLHGMWGISCFPWYKGFFNGERFAIGRFQYEEKLFFGEKYEYNNVCFTNEDKVVGFHIPSGSRMDVSDMKKSLALAYEHFYDKYNKDGVMLITCSSWLLYPKHGELYAEGSNLRKFYDLFDVLSFGMYENFANCWRVFNTHDYSDPDKLPQNTSLQRAFVKYIKDGGDFGYGNGVIPMDKKKYKEFLNS